MPVSVALRRFELADLDEAAALMTRACAFEQAGIVARRLMVDSGLSGAPHAMVAQRTSDTGEAIAGVAASCGRWLRVLAVAPEWRGRGVGSALLDDAERVIAASGHGAVEVLGEPANYLAPGIDQRDLATIEWLERRGYTRRGTRCNLLIDMQGNPRVSRAQADELAEGCRGYEVRRAGPGDSRALQAWIGEEFGEGWAFAAAQAVEQEPPAVHIALAAGGEIAAFAAHDGATGRGWFGPTGTRDAHRGKGLGKALLVACLADVADAGHERCEIAWIGPRDFYRRSVGVVGERNFVVLRKDLS